MCSCNDNSILLESKMDVSRLDPVFEKYGGGEGSLITVLQKAQDIYGYLPVGLLNYIARKMNLKPAKVFGVATFYTQFRLKPAGKYLILVCQGTACHVNGSAAIEEALKEELGVGEDETTDDGLFTYINVACLGCCSLSPVMMINGETFGSLTVDSVKKIIADFRNRDEGK